MNYPKYTQAVASFGDAFPGSAGPFVTPGTSPYQRSGSAASLAAFGAGAPDAGGPKVVGMPNPIDVEERRTSQAIMAANYVIGSAAGLAGAYHGYKRNESVGWAIGWSLLSSLFWPIAVPVMIAQGFGKPAAMKKNRRSKKRSSMKRRRHAG